MQWTSANQRATTTGLGLSVASQHASSPGAVPSNNSQAYNRQFDDESQDSHLKSGWLWKRTKQRSWNKRWFVLRERQLTYYKDETEYKPRQVIATADIMTAAMVTDQHRPGHFAVYTSQRTIHLRDENANEARDWVELIRHAANAVAESILSSSFQRLQTPSYANEIITNPPNMAPLDSVLVGATTSPSQRVSLGDYASGVGVGGERGGERGGVGGVGRGVGERGGERREGDMLVGPHYTLVPHGSMSSQGSIVQSDMTSQEYAVESSSPENRDHEEYTDEEFDVENEKIIKQGYLYRLKNRYNQWKRQWVVLSTARVLLFKSDNIHKTPVKSLGLDTIADAVDIEPLSKSKTLCMQLITDKHRVKFCAESEDELTSWLASFKAALSRYRQHHFE